MSRTPTTEATTTSRVFLGAFGKHPGWDDHIEDLGLETPALVAFKRLLYLEGIGRNIDAGAWAQLPEPNRIEGFRHVFLWRGADGLILGRMWASRDGKGRSLYPMIVCLECRGLPTAWILEHALPRLESLEQEVRQLQAAADVRALVDRTRDGLREHAATAASDAVLPEWFSGRGALEALGDDPTAFRRILYKIERDWMPYLKGAPGAAQDRPALHARLPAALPDEHGALLLWAGLLLSLLDPATPLFMAHPLGTSWQDLIAGPADARSLFCLLASLQAIPLATDIPYSMEEAFVARADARAEAWRTTVFAFDGLLRPAAPGRAGASVKSILASWSTRFGGRRRAPDGHPPPEPAAD